MRLLALSGQRSAALAQFETCRRTLREELGVEPSAETLHLRQQIESQTLSLERPAGNFPTPTTPFFGRESELSRLAGLLNDPDTRLLTLTGPAGIGKTRLALQLGIENACVFEHGVSFIPLTGLLSIELLPAALADGVGLQLQGSDNPLTQLSNYLREKELLLFLDNCEHLLPALADLAADILQRAPRVTMVATSRQPLDLQSERLFDVEGLGGASVSLFAERAQRVQPAFSLTPQNTPWVEQVCRLCEGMPLAIELAAAWARRLSPAEICTEIERGLDVLASTRRDLPDRHRSLRAAFDYSWALLAPLEQAVFMQTAIFRAGFSLEVARAVIATGSVDSIETVLHSLVDKSLLRRRADGRFDAHELLRQYAAEKLRGTSQMYAQVSSSHAGWYANWLHTLLPSLRRATPSVLDAVSLEIENVRQGWHWAVDTRALHLLDQCAEPFALFLVARGWFPEMQNLFSSAVRVADDRLEESDLGVSGGRLLAFLGVALQYQGQAQEALPLLAQALEQERRSGDPARVAYCLNQLGYAYCLLGDYTNAKKYSKEGLELAHHEENEYLLPKLLNNLGLVAMMQGDYAGAKTCYTDSFTIDEGLENLQGMSLSLNNLSTIAYYSGDYPLALEYGRRGLSLSRQLKNTYSAGLSLTNLGNASHALGDYETAIRYFQEGAELSQEMGDRLGLARALMNLGNSTQSSGRASEAIPFHQRALALLGELGHRWGIAVTLINLADDYLLTHHLSKAKQALRDGLQLAHEIQAMALVYAAILGYADLSARRGDFVQAVELAGFVVDIPGQDSENKEQAQRILAETQGKITDSERETIIKQRQRLSLETVLAVLLETV